MSLVSLWVCLCRLSVCLYVYMSICMYVRTYVCCQHFQTSSRLKPLGRLKPNFKWSLLGMGKRSFVQKVLVKWPRWPRCSYMIKTLKIFFSGTKRSMTLKLDIQHWVLEFKWWPWIDSDLFYGKVTFASFNHSAVYILLLVLWDQREHSEKSEINDWFRLIF